MGPLRVLRVVFALVSVSVTPLWAATHTVRVVRIADTTTPVPGGIGRFQTLAARAFGSYGSLLKPVLDNGVVAFVGEDEKMQPGVYVHVDGQIHVIADRQTAIPNPPLNGPNFVRFGHIAFDAGLLAFRAVGGNVNFPGRSGVYAYHLVEGTLELVADNVTPVPGEDVRFNGFQLRPATDNGAVLFHANWYPEPNQPHHGLFLAIDGQLELLLDQDTINPATGEPLGTFAGGAALALDGRSAAFVNADGVLVHRGGTLETVADFSTPIPEGTGMFTEFNPISIAMDQGLVFFHGLRTSPADPFQHGLYLWRDGTLERVVDLATAIPDAPDGFLSFAWPSLDAGNVAFRGDTRPQGLFARIDGIWVTIRAPLAPLPGGLLPRTIVPSGLDGRQIAFVASFGTGAEALYLATIENVCGDGAVEPNEECDDGNQIDGDGCSAACEREVVDFAGCGPGFWKQAHHLRYWMRFTSEDLFDEVFDVDGFGFDVTLLDALWQGGGREFALGRQAVAAILNAAHPDVDYFFTTEEVIDQVADAFGTTAQEVLKDVLETENERGCTVIKHEAPPPIRREPMRAKPDRR